MEKNKKNPLTPIEWDTLWMAIRYAMNGQTIATASLPPDIIKAYYHRLTEEQKVRICEDLKRNIERWGKFGNPNIDDRIWMKFWYALDVTKHKEITAIDDTKHIVFEVLYRVYPLAQYVENPHREIDMPVENIKIKTEK